MSSADPHAGPPARASADRLVRHAACDRALHWISALAVLVLMGTAFLPILGLQFGWVTAHWITGVVLSLAVLVHTVRAAFWQDLKSMWIGRRDCADLWRLIAWTLRRSDAPPPKPGKYSLAQKLAHHVFTVLVLGAVVSGALMLVRIDTPWWQRNPYWLSADLWGVVYVVHGLAALGLISTVIVHVYFALRPEKRMFLRSMLVGWITRQEYRAYHDPGRWQE